MNTTHDHTPTPWHIGMKPGPAVYGPLGEQIVNPHNPLMDFKENCANAAFIVQCVNSHEALVEALKDALSYIRQDCEERGITYCFKNAEQALAHAEGRD